MSMITYANKETLNAQPSIADKNKCTANDMNEIKSVINNKVGDVTNLNTTNKTSIVGAINEVKNDLSGILLWENPNPTSSFSAQNITLSSNNYDMLEIFYYSYTDRVTVNSVKVKKGQDANLMAIFQYQNHGWIGNRDIRYTNDTQLYVDSTVSIVRNDAFSRQAENTWCIPIFIIGYKLGIFN